MIKRILKYIGIALLAFILILTTWIWYLYSAADMMAPNAEYAAWKLGRPASGSAWKSGRPASGLRQSESGLWELYVEGDAFQRGEAIGHLSKDLLYYQEKVFVDQIREIIPSDSYLKFLRFFIILFNRNLGKNIPEEYRQEIYAISQSCTHEYDMIGTPYERQLNYHAAHDLGHAMQDYMLVGCSSFASWGKHSEDSSLVIGRNFDFYMGDDFARNKQVAFYRPSTGHNFVTIGWVGMTGVLSGMNEHGLTVTINAAKSTMPTSSATPISVLTREILQYAQTIDEAYEIAKKRKTFVAESILIGSAKDGKATIIEKSPDHIALFTQDNQQQLICTNHYQSETYANEKNNIENMKTSDSPYRFERLKELLAQEGKMNERKAADILRNYKGRDDADLGLANEMAINQFIAHHSVIFKPAQRLIWVSTSPWQCGKYVAYDLNKIFNDSLDFSRELYVEELTIPADTFVQQPEYQQLITYKQLTPLIRKKSAKKEAISEDTLQLYRTSNPTMFYTHEILGDYYLAIGEIEKAKTAWNKALTLPIPKKGEEERIRKKIGKF